ncbi:MAG: hypothetical protein WCJ58_03135 [bacterium]
MNKKLTIRLSDLDYTRAKVLVAERGITLSTFFREALDSALVEEISPEYEAYLIQKELELKMDMKAGKTKVAYQAEDFFTV